MPQDVVRAANGISIQVIHTDAEGRMVLADTLALAGRTRPRLIMDFATLTGACVYSLWGAHERHLRATAGAGADTALAAGARAASVSGIFPLMPTTTPSSRAGSPMSCNARVDGKADHILAARFLSRFVPEDIAWIHMDLSAAARSGGLAHINTDITGFGVRYTLELLRSGNAAAARKPGDDQPDAPRPDDWHLHLRDGEAMAAVLPFTAARFGARHRHAESQAADHHHASRRSPTASGSCAALPPGAVSSR